MGGRTMRSHDSDLDIVLPPIVLPTSDRPDFDSVGQKDVPDASQSDTIRENFDPVPTLTTGLA